MAPGSGALPPILETWEPLPRTPPASPRQGELRACADPADPAKPEEVPRGAQQALRESPRGASAPEEDSPACGAGDDASEAPEGARRRPPPPPPPLSY